MRKFQMGKMTISIVNFNGGDYIISCLESLEKISDELKFDIQIVDNASTDDSVSRIQKKFPKVKITKNEENVGFGRAHNQILKEVDSEYLLILNPDVELEKGVLKKLVQYFEENEDTGALTPKIILSSGKIDLTAHRGFPTPLASFMYYFFKNDNMYHLTERNNDLIHEVDSISGAFMLTKKDVLERSGYFDEEYFMYGEDLDLCFRIKEAGFKIIYDPEVSVVHHKGISSGLKKDTQKNTTADIQTKKRSLDAFYDAMQIFYRKHYQKSYPFFINWMVYTGIRLKWFLAKRRYQV